MADSGLSTDDAWQRRLPRVRQRAMLGDFPADRINEYETHWRAGYEQKPFPSAGVEDGFVDEAFFAGGYARSIDRGDQLLADSTTECSDCSASVEAVIGCPDGAEVCEPCFESGAH